MDKREIVKLSPDDWAKYKTLRLAALQEDPLAFGLTFEEYSSYPDDFWKDQLIKAEKEKDSWIYFAIVEGKLVGMLAADRVSKKRMDHLAHIHSMSVKKEYRGKGLATKLLRTILEKLGQQADLIMGQMGVASSQNHAVALYQKFGFKIVGTRKKVFKYQDQFYDEILMEKELN